MKFEKNKWADLTTPEQQLYRGRFAPSPTGPLHLGSLYTALAGFLDARSHQGKWLLRIDDLDTPRNVKGAADAILKTLERFGLYWDDTVTYQSHYLDIYNDYLDKLTAKQLIYPCICSRKTLATSHSDSSPADVYPGTCRELKTPPNVPHSLRLKTDNHPIAFVDGLQGPVSHHLADQDGDFVVKRKDQIIAYQFAVVIDDYLQQINHVVRGADLLDSTPKQIYLQQILGLFTPEYLHVPVIIGRQGYKLSKQTLATAIDGQQPQALIFGLLVLLKQNPPPELRRATAPELMDWAVAHWNPAALKNLRAISEKID